MRVLITGGTGFVGSYLVRELISQGALCRLLVRNSTNTAELVNKNNVELWQGDLTRSDTLSGISKDMDYVYHLAAAGHVSAISREAYKTFAETNVDGTRNLVTECGNRGQIKKFIHFSSTAAMGLIKKRFVDESDQPRPATPYQKSKLESESAALGLGKKHGVPVVVLRPCMIYGKYGKGEFYKMCRLMRKGLFPRVGSGRNLTPIIHVQDVVQGALSAAEKGLPGETYLLASARSMELSEMRDMVMAAWGAKAGYPYVPVWFMYVSAWCFEVFARMTGRAPVVTRRNIASTVWDREFSIEKAKRDLEYNPRVSFREGIFETVEWFKAIG